MHPTPVGTACVVFVYGSPGPESLGLHLHAVAPPRRRQVRGPVLLANLTTQYAQTCCYHMQRAVGRTGCTQVAGHATLPIRLDPNALFALVFMTAVQHQNHIRVDIVQVALQHTLTGFSTPAIQSLGLSLFARPPRPPGQRRSFRKTRTRPASSEAPKTPTKYSRNRRIVSR